MVRLWLNSASWSRKVIAAALRAEAEALAKTRNEYYHRATQAFVAGKKVDATTFSARGKKAEAAMEVSNTSCTVARLTICQDAQAKAASFIFAARNGVDGCKLDRPDKGIVAVDTHGLHVHEAIDAMMGALERAASLEYREGEASAVGGGWCTWCCILAGTGHHSRDATRRLMPNLKQALDDEGISYEERGAGGHGGVLTVRVSELPDEWRT